VNAQPEAAQAVAKRLDEQLDALLTATADNFGTSRRSPVLHTPAEYGLRFVDLIFHSEGGIPLQRWFVPVENSDTVVIVNHPRFASRSTGTTDGLVFARSDFFATMVLAAILALRVLVQVFRSDTG
jgi:uncharacterized protein